MNKLPPDWDHDRFDRACADLRASIEDLMGPDYLPQLEPLAFDITADGRVAMREASGGIFQEMDGAIELVTTFGGQRMFIELKPGGNLNMWHAEPLGRPEDN